MQNGALQDTAQTAIKVIYAFGSHLRWLEIVFEIFFTRKQFTFIYIIISFTVAT